MARRQGGRGIASARVAPAIPAGPHDIEPQRGHAAGPAYAFFTIPRA